MGAGFGVGPRSWSDATVLHRIRCRSSASSKVCCKPPAAARGSGRPGCGRVTTVAAESEAGRVGLHREGAALLVLAACRDWTELTRHVPVAEPF